MGERILKFAVPIYLVALGICALSDNQPAEPHLFMACRDWLMLGIGIGWGALIQSLLATPNR